MKSSSQPESHIFTLRVWREELDDGQFEWRGRIHHVQSGQTRHFRDWVALVPLLLSLLRGTPVADQPPDP
jgi:hypothetical protein